MEECKQIWNWDLDTMTELEFDAFLDHALLCKAHERVLNLYERSTEPIIDAAFGNDISRASNIVGLEKNRAFPSYSSSLNASGPGFNSISIYARFFALFANGPAAAASILLLCSFFAFRISDSRNLPVVPEKTRAGRLDAGNAPPSVSTGLPGTSGLSGGKANLISNRARDFGTSPNTALLDLRVSTPLNQVPALFEAEKKETITGTRAGCGKGYEERSPGRGGDPTVPVDKNDNDSHVAAGNEEKTIVKAEIAGHLKDTQAPGPVADPGLRNHKSDNDSFTTAGNSGKNNFKAGVFNNSELNAECLKFGGQDAHGECTVKLTWGGGF